MASPFNLANAAMRLGINAIQGVDLGQINSIDYFVSDFCSVMAGLAECVPAVPCRTGNSRVLSRQNLKRTK